MQSVCQKGQGTGFFCKIPLSLDKYLKVFMTNNHVIDKDYLDKKNEIIISLEDDKYIQSINLKNKITYTNEIYDTTIIILDKNDCENIEFLDLGDNILNNNGEIYEGNSIYILQYPGKFGENKVAVSYGILKQRFDKEEIYNFAHYCCTDHGSSGSPILKTSNNRIIGIHKQSSLEDEYNIGEYNIGAFLYESIKEFIQLYIKTNNELRGQPQLTNDNRGKSKSKENLNSKANINSEMKSNVIDKKKLKK